MAKSKKSIDDLDAELAALEAELAALEGTKAAPKAPKKGFGFAKKEPRQAPGPAPAAAPAPVPEAPAPVQSAPENAQPANDLSLWRRDGNAWVRVVPGHARVVRRVLDEQGNVIREEPASRADIDDVSEVKAERAVGKLLGRLRK